MSEQINKVLPETHCETAMPPAEEAECWAFPNYPVRHARPAAEGRGFFVLTVPAYCSHAMLDRLQDQWLALHKGRPPGPLMVLQADMKLEAFGDAELRDYGLMRIPAAESAAA